MYNVVDGTRKDEMKVWEKTEGLKCHWFLYKFFMFVLLRLHLFTSTLLSGSSRSIRTFRSCWFLRCGLCLLLLCDLVGWFLLLGFSWFLSFGFLSWSLRLGFLAGGLGFGLGRLGFGILLFLLAILGSGRCSRLFGLFFGALLKREATQLKWFLEGEALFLLCRLAARSGAVFLRLGRVLAVCNGGGFSIAF